jgi:tetratricopeptide (TPR) repeat protein
LYEQALTIARDIGYRYGEANQLGNLGNCYADLGQTRRAIDLYEQALTIARDIGYRQGEAIYLGNLGICYADLGQTRRAIDLHEQALTIARDIGYRQGEAAQLGNLGNRYAELGQWEHAAEYHRRAIEIADAIGSAQMQAEARQDLAHTQLWAEDLSTAQQTITTARDYPYPPAQARIALLTGIIALRVGDITAAAAAFRDAVTATATDNRLHHSPEDYDALDTQALALLGLTLTGPDDHTAAAATVFRAARTITTAEGITRRIQRDLDTLTPADPTGIIHHIHPTATGHP